MTRVGVGRRIEFRESRGGVQPQCPILVAQCLLQRRHRLTGAVLNQRIEHRRSRIDGGVTEGERVGGAERIGAAGRLHLSDHLRGRSPHGEVRLLQLRHRDGRRVRGLEVSEGAEHGRKHPLVFVAQHRLHAPECHVCRHRRQHGRHRRADAPIADRGPCSTAPGRSCRGRSRPRRGVRRRASRARDPRAGPARLAGRPRPSWRRARPPPRAGRLDRLPDPTRVRQAAHRPQGRRCCRELESPTPSLRSGFWPA